MNSGNEFDSFDYHWGGQDYGADNAFHVRYTSEIFLVCSAVILCVHIQNECDYIQKGGFECADTRNECDHIRWAPRNSPVEGR